MSEFISCVLSVLDSNGFQRIPTVSKVDPVKFTLVASSWGGHFKAKIVVLSCLVMFFSVACEDRKRRDWRDWCFGLASSAQLHALFL